MSVDARKLLENPAAELVASLPGSFVARAPGRVNLIGEHTDYNGLPVLPMAIDRDIVLLAAPLDEPVIRLHNADARFGLREFPARAALEPFEQGDWGNYAKAAVVAVTNWAGIDELSGFEAVIAGDIPPGSGLSSSSAMVVACAKALLHSNGLDMPKEELSELLAKGERYVGTEGGGMDQTVSIMAEAGKALRIDFFPIRARPVPLPEGYSILVCNTLVAAKKSGAARNAYNTRVVECRIGLSLLTQALGIPCDFSPRLLGDLMRPEAGTPLEQLLAAVEYLPEQEDNPSEELRRLRDGSLLPIPEGGFKIRSRCRHVYTEALRVETASDVPGPKTLGDLMNASHESCAGDYEVSCPELDALVRFLLDSGALGARLTGAGFGGCAIALVRDDRAAAVMDSIEDRYYRNYLPNTRPDIAVPRDLSTAVFACKPGAGAGIRVR